MKYLSVACLFIVSVLAHGAHDLNSDLSLLSVMSTKKSSISEIHTFSGLRGSISDAGKVCITVPLASIETGIEIRNQRMREFLFNTEQFPSATFAVTLNNIDEINGLSKGEYRDLRLTGVITMNGRSVETLMTVVVIRQLDGSLRASTKHPFIVNADDFGYVAGIEKLKELAKLSSISTAVPVTFSVVFN